MKITHISLFVVGACAFVAPLSAGPGCGGCAQPGAKQAVVKPVPTQSECGMFTQEYAAKKKSECADKRSISGQWSSNTNGSRLTLWDNGTFVLSEQGRLTVGQYAVDKDELVLKTQSSAKQGEWVSHRYQLAEKPDSLTLSTAETAARSGDTRFVGVWSYQDEAPQAKG